MLFIKIEINAMVNQNDNKIDAMVSRSKRWERIRRCRIKKMGKDQMRPLFEGIGPSNRLDLTKYAGSSVVIRFNPVV